MRRGRGGRLPASARVEGSLPRHGHLLPRQIRVLVPSAESPHAGLRFLRPVQLDGPTLSTFNELRGRVSMGGEVALQCLYCSLVYKSSTINRPTGTVAPKGA
jgi:hypothetical protein